MSLLAWTFLFGALAVVGPIVAHLLSKPRFRRVPFTMLRFLRAGQSRSHSRRRLRDLLILLLRSAIIVLIAILFAQPVVRIKAEPPVQRTVIHLALDDSMSTAYRDGNRSLIERMIERAVERIRQAPDDAAFSVYGLASGRSSQGLPKNDAIAAIRRFKAVPAAVRPADFFSALRQAGRAAAQGDIISAVVLSDFTPATLRQFEQVQSPLVVDEIHCERITPDKAVENTAIVAARVASLVGDALSLDVTLAHYGSAPQQRTLAARLPDRGLVCKQELSIGPRQRKVVRLQIGLDAQLRQTDQPCLPIELSLSPGDGLVEDDAYRIAAYIPRATQTNVVLVHRGEETFLFETAMQALSGSGALEWLHLTKVPQDRVAARDLDGADVVVFSSLPVAPSLRPADLKAFAQKGGRLVFFTTGASDLPQAKPLWRDGLLAAQPQRWVQTVTYPEPQPPAGIAQALDERAARSLSNYRLDQVALKGCWQCQPAAQSQCLWRLTGGEGLIYSMPCGYGLSIFVNTSMDGSLGLLAKSPAWVAFCRGLIGQTDEVGQFCFSTGERPVLRLAEYKARDGRTAVSVQNCDGSSARAASQGSLLLLPAATGLGWMKTTDAPVLYAGINLPAGETDLAAPTQEQIDDIVRRVFVQGKGRGADAESALGLRPSVSGLQQRPIWPIFAWAAMVLLVLESAVANRLKR